MMVLQIQRRELSTGINVPRFKWDGNFVKQQ